jgi:putative flavoprotein involved in K+ transport
MESIYDVIVIGGGHAGLATSYCLNQNNLSHVVLERGRIGESWLSQRWDSFKLNTPNWINKLPGYEYIGNDREGFSSAQDFAGMLRDYSVKHSLPVMENAKVISLDKSSGTNGFRISVSENGNVKEYNCRQVVIASGCQNDMRIPGFAQNISPDILQIHAGDYRNSWQIPDGGVLVTGSAQSGVQIAEDLLDSGRDVYFSTSMVPRARRRYRGRDMAEWFILTKFFDVKKEEVPDPQMLTIKQPQISGLGKRGHTVSLQYLAKHGATILGKLQGAEGTKVFFRPDAGKHVKFADEFSKKFRDMIDGYITQSGMDAAGPEPDFADEPDVNCECDSGITTLDLKGNNINSIIWTTGFGGDYSWINLPALDSNRQPKHKDGVSDIEGMYYTGLVWQRKRKSGIIYGAAEDAEYIAERIREKRK